MTTLKPSACFLLCIDGTVWGRQLNFFFFSMIFRKHFNWPGLSAPLPTLVKIELFGQDPCHPNLAGSCSILRISSQIWWMFVNLLLRSSWQEVASWMRDLYDAKEDPSGLGSSITMKIFTGEPRHQGVYLWWGLGSQVGEALTLSVAPCFSIVCLRVERVKITEHLVSEYLWWMKM